MVGAFYPMLIRERLDPPFRNMWSEYLDRRLGSFGGPRPQASKRMPMIQIHPILGPSARARASPPRPPHITLPLQRRQTPVG